MVVNMWQDVNVTEPTAPPTSASAAETLKALADPLRLRLLSALMPGSAQALPVMTVKELAAALGEPQTKLYRHVKQLEAAGLIQVVASRVVSGIVEQRYQACQSDLRFGPELTLQERNSATMEAAVAAALELYRTRFFAAQRGGEMTEPPGRRVTLSISEERMSQAKAAVVYERLAELIKLLDSPEEPGDDHDETVVVHALFGYYTTTAPAL